MWTVRVSHSFLSSLFSPSLSSTCTHVLALSERDSCQSALSPPCFPFSRSQTIDQLSGIQAELQESVKELAKAKKKYYDCEQVAHAVREKADIEAK